MSSNIIISSLQNKIMAQSQEDFSLAQENLIPFYIIQDRVKENFNKIQKLLKKQFNTNDSLKTETTKINEYNKKYKEEVNQKFIELEKKIINEINSELEGRIIVAINKNMAAFSSRMEEKQKQITKINEGIDQKINGIKKAIVFEVSKENQKFFSKQAQKLEKKIKTSVAESSKKSNLNNKQSTTNLKSSLVDKSHQQLKNTQKAFHYDPNHNPQTPETYFSQQWVLKIKQMDGKLERLQEFSVNFDKKLYQSMTSLKDSWKELGQDVIDTKRKITAKQDELKLQLIKIKGIKEFDGAPENLEQTFKTKLMNKFTQIYQTISHLCSKTDLQSMSQKFKKTLSRHDNELSDVRQELARNSEYFTFYMNNSNQDDLSSKIKELNDIIIQKDISVHEKFKKQIEKNEILQTQIAKFTQIVDRQVQKNAKLQKDHGNIREELFKQIQRIDVLEDQNSMSPQKMAKIHNTLDIDFSPSQQELIAHKNHTSSNNIVIKELKGEINKLKDELFVINHEFKEMEKMKKNMNGIQSKLDKIKIQSQQAILSRKPWVCLSCDKQKNEQEKNKRQLSKKKLLQNRGLFGKDKSDKMIKMIPSPQQKFQVYQKYREKYLSDTVRLPDIYKEKIGENSPFDKV